MLCEVIDSVKITNCVTLINVYNIKSENNGREYIFRKFAENNINLDMISQTPCFGGEITLSFTLNDNDLPSALTVISRINTEFGSLETNICSDNIEISMTGLKMTTTPGVADKVFDEFSKKKINIILITTSDISISCLIAKADEVKVIKLLEDNRLDSVYI